MLQNDAKVISADIQEEAPLIGLSAEPKQCQPLVDKSNETTPKRVNFQPTQQSAEDEVIKSDVKQNPIELSQSDRMKNEDKSNTDTRVNNSTPEERAYGLTSDIKEADDTVTMSTLPREAKLQFIWKKTLPTTDKCVRLKTNKMKVGLLNK